MLHFAKCNQNFTRGKLKQSQEEWLHLKLILLDLSILYLNNSIMTYLCISWHIQCTQLASICPHRDWGCNCTEGLPCSPHQAEGPWGHSPREQEEEEKPQTCSFTALCISP